MPTTNHLFKSDIQEMGYKLFLPNGYVGNKNEFFPLILFLHGIKRRGNDLSLLDGYGLMQIAEQDPGFNYIVITPQCPINTFWPENHLILVELVNRLIREYRVDQSRIYLTGFSMGGNGVWDLAAKTRGLFAAAVPIAGWYESNEAQNLTHIPIWVFHGEKDDVVPVSYSESMVNAIKRIDGDIKFTRYSDFDHSHNVMKETFTNPELYSWLEMNKKTD
ncbi:dienelactone hydrolase family protein [Cohnella terricola]|nr:dienelactone hydrolase family protein [Cohnella terricola]